MLIFPIPWEVTASYGGGASGGPLSILSASAQLDYWDPEFGDIRSRGIYWEGLQDEITVKNQKYKKIAQQAISEFDETGVVEKYKDNIISVNKASEEVNLWLYNKTKQALSEGKFIGTLGGDHSSPLGAMKAYCEHYTNFGVLHIDAHADLRLAYQGFSYSHASIMRNLMELNQAPSALVQVAVRDYCEEEWSYIQSRENIKCFFDRDLKKQLFSGTQWHSLCHSIIKSSAYKCLCFF